MFGQAGRELDHDKDDDASTSTYKNTFKTFQNTIDEVWTLVPFTVK